jgi:tetratricopeptide (TPR) repeat protein
MFLDEALTLAERHRREGRLTEAETLCRRALEAQPNLPEAEHLMGVIAHQNGKLGEAIEHARRAVELAPDVALLHANLGEMLRLVGQPSRAVEAAQRALAIDPSMPAALSNLGAALFELKEFEGAALAQRRAIALMPDFAEAHSNLGNALHALRRFEEAVECYRRAIDLKPAFADAWANLGTTLHHGGRFAEGGSALRRAIALFPGHANAHSGLGILLLMRGEFGEGWDEYEWRLRSSERKGPRFPERAWQGDSLVSKSIYVQAEQGLGDTLQFVRYVPLLAARGARVTLRVQQSLVSLLRENLPGVAVLGERGEPAPFQYDVALLSLPRLFRTRLESIPADMPYLRPPTEAALRWRNRLAGMAGLKVAVAWAGSPDHANDSRRSLALSTLTPLFSARGASFASLQVGPRAADLKRPPDRRLPIEDLSAALPDFAETAAALAALDLTITVDTAVAHLAGAMGKPVWALLPWVSDWRWMLSRSDSPWYPTMRLYRQEKGEDWSDVIGRVVADLAAVAKGDATLLTPFRVEGERRAAHAAAIIAAQAVWAEDPSKASIEKSPGQTLILAERKIRLGLLADADDLARQAAVVEPDNAEAWHMLAIVAHQSGKTGEAIEHLERAIQNNPNVALYHANLGEMRRLVGRIDEAILAGRRALELRPDFPAALSNLGIALFDQGEFEEALAQYDRAIALQDDFAQAHSNRGNALLRLKRYPEAESAYRRAIELQPAFADAWNNLGASLRELKRPEEAEAAYLRSLELSPDNPKTLDNLALALRDLERLEEAAGLLRRALASDEANSQILLHYGAVLLDLHNVEAAATATERALALDPNNHDCVNQMGRVAFERGDPEGALGWLRRALALKPDLADAHNNMGNVLKEIGRLQEAERAYLDSIRLDPTIAGVYLNLADLTKFSPGHPLLAAMETFAQKGESLSRTDRLQLNFALGKVYADLKDYDRSFTCLIRANAAKRAKISYDEASTMALFDRIEAIFTRDLIAAKSGGGDLSSRPIFVIGMPRSGTTLVEQIIASHPNAFGGGELQTLNDVVLAIRDVDGETASFPEFVAAIDRPALTGIGAQYISRLREVAVQGEWVTDKMPSNYYFAGLIHLALPNAKIIHCRRNPIDTCVSCFSKLFSAEQNHTYDLGELGRYYRRYERLMAHWRGVLPAGRILEVQYEDVVADLGGQARRIIAHCGLAWDARCLAFHNTERPVRTASAAQVREPIYRSAIGRWRAYEKHLGPLKEALGPEASPRA